MRHHFIVALLAIAGACAPQSPLVCPLPEGLPVFPGAEGFGTDTPAGRGGAVLEVTNLDDDGPGSLRAAVAAPGPRIVVFRVGGTITLQSSLEVIEPFVTIAGQTAPGDGVLLKNAGVTVFTHDVLIQHLRIRPGISTTVAADVNDALTVLALAPGEGHHVVIDHVSVSWGEDENVAVTGGVRDVTVSRSIIGEGLDKARHSKGTHSAGLLFGYDTSCTTTHHNLFAHNRMRNPLLSDSGLHDVVNNLVYNWGDAATNIGTAAADALHANVVGNHYVPGASLSEPDTFAVVASQGDDPINHFTEPRTLFGPAGELLLYLADNVGPHAEAGDPFAIASLGWGDVRLPAAMRAAERLQTAPVTTEAGADVVVTLLADVGATPARRDAVDTRIVDDVRNGTGEIIDSPEEVGGHPALAPGAALPDGDHDGMPDAWEDALGLDAASAEDAIDDDDGDGYTNVEEYLHSLAAALGGG
ncbi:MAG: hypothetical protein A2138_21275 [Deltaproteobacteria bacterium RBG_16_71_12]|nr:MAG: hypothetical protein A2138_21275 [Deltaproteobacteria bacterium RBG_16_71_12]